MTLINKNSYKITEGTKEWADSNVNIYSGCSNDCRYCYAKKIAIRFKRKTNETWKIMEPCKEKILKGYRKRSGRVMFPTSHDITKESLENSLIVLKKLIDAKNEVLITTKPNFFCIKTISNQLKNKKELFQFRFTITSMNNNTLEFWEPNAPRFKERFKCLKYTHENGFKTSIAIEPFLDINPFLLVDKLKPFTTESIWIGKMNYIKASNIPDDHQKYYNQIRKITDKKNLRIIIKKARNYDDNFLRIKDSIFNALNH